MRKAIIKFFAVFFLLVALFVLQKLVFIGVYSSVIGPSVQEYLKAVGYGLGMDMSMSGYLTILPALLIALETKFSSPVFRTVEKGYYALVALIISLVFWLDIVLYGYWGFRLDMTPVFYFTTSPLSAMASAEWWMIPCALAGVVLTAWAIWAVFAALVIPIRISPTPGKDFRPTLVMLMLTVLLFLPIRGSLTVSTMNPSRGYFSTNQRLNHAAVNPMFSLMYSAAHQSNYGDQYHFMDGKEASAILGRLYSARQRDPEMTEGQVRTDSDTVLFSPDSLLVSDRPDIYLIILESFSAHLLPSMGGAPIATGLDSIAGEGILFTNFYAGSFRTDRALPAILSALPPQPSTSILKYVDKIERLPSLPKALEKAGYSTAYYYGGDANFTNMMAYLTCMGIDPIISDKDFPVGERTSKWGAHDHILFEKLKEDILRDKHKTSGTADPTASHSLTIVQTSSSHEPFEVPYRNSRLPYDDPRVNAFAYTDSCVTDFAEFLRNRKEWDNTLIVAIPDHWGAWPEIEDAPGRHHIPLIIAGGALTDYAKGLRIDRIGQQTDLAVTLLSLLSAEETATFPFSKNLLSDTVAEFAFFSDPNLMGLITPSDTTVIDPSMMPSVVISHDGISETSYPHRQIEAYLQKLYEYISDL